MRRKLLINALGLFLAGSLWGIMEVLGGEPLFKTQVPQASVVLTAWALLVLAAARTVWNAPGTSTAVGLVAALYKLINAAPFFCHLLGIFILGVAFDLLASALLKKPRTFSVRSVATGVFSPLASNIVFGFLMTYVIHYQHWTSVKFVRHAFISGGLTAAAGALLVPLGLWLGLNAQAFTLRRPRLAFAGTLAGLVVVWTLGRVF